MRAFDRDTRVEVYELLSGARDRVRPRGGRGESARRRCDAQVSTMGFLVIGGFAFRINMAQLTKVQHCFGILARPPEAAVC